MLLDAYIQSLGNRGPDLVSDQDRRILGNLLKMNVTESKKYIKQNPTTPTGILIAKILKHRDRAAAKRVRQMMAPKKPEPIAIREPSGTFPKVGEDGFGQKIINMPTVLAHQSAPFDRIVDTNDLDERVQDACERRGKVGDIELMMHQRFVQKFLSDETPYKGLLLYHQVGVGKTCSAIAVAEGYLDRAERELRMSKPVLVIASRSLHQEFQRQVFDIKGGSCVGSKYMSRALAMDPSLQGDALKNKIALILRARYQFMGYEEFANRFESAPDDFIDRLVIVDEVHNMRKSDATKQAAVALEGLARRPDGGNMLLFMTATPMYNEAAEFYQLLALLSWNDGRNEVAAECVKAAANPLSDTSKQLIWRLGAEYVSFVRGTNPVAFPYKMDASICLPEEDIMSPERVPKYGWHAAKIPTEEKGWFQYLPSLVTVEQSELQKKAIKAVEKGGVSITALNQELAYNNIVFPRHDAQHKDGLLSGMFMTDDGKFRSREDFLQPHRLSHFAPKLAKVLEVAQKCEGIAVIYSQYIWNGVLPLALALEYMGYQNWSKNLLDERVSVKAKKSKYAILCGDSMFTAANLAGVLREINDPSNMNGEKIKFVIISQVASEGISFKNVRSVHVVDPWFHYNRTEQIIGRAVRTCSHSKLSAEKRNVGIFLYMLSDGSRETADIYTYRMAAMKRREILELTREIRSHAVDCYLHRSKNYYPPSAPMDMRTPLGKMVRIVVGDQVSDEYMCSAVPQGKRYSLGDFTPRELDQWSAYYQRMIGARLPKDRAMPIADLAKMCGAEGRILQLLFAYTIQQMIANHTMTSLYRIDMNTGMIAYAPVTYQVTHPVVYLKPLSADVPKAPGSASESITDLESQLAALSEDEVSAKVLLYSSITPAYFSWVLRNMKKAPITIKLLDQEGVFVYDHELEGRKKGSGEGKKVGHFDIFHVETRLDKEVHPVMYLWKAGKHQEAPIEETKKVAGLRKAKKVPTTATAGISAGFIARQKKGAVDPEIRLKIFDLAPGERTKTGFDCQQTSTFGVAIVKEKLASILKDVPIPNTNSKGTLCHALAVGMGKLSKQSLMFPPYLHPIG